MRLLNGDGPVPFFSLSHKFMGGYNWVDSVSFVLKNIYSLTCGHKGLAVLPNRCCFGGSIMSYVQSC